MADCCSSISIPCPSYPNTNCVVYTGAALSTIGANANDRLDSILSKIDTVLSTIVVGTTYVIGDGGCIEVTGIGSILDPFVISYICSPSPSVADIQTTTLNGDGITTEFTLPHLTPSATLSMVTSGSSDAANFLYVTTDSTYIHVYFAVAPPIGTGNLIFNWIVS